MPNTEIDQDAKIAANIEPDGATGALAYARRVPLYTWAALALAVFVIVKAGNIVSPFIVGALIAYILSAAVDRLQKRIPLPRILIITLIYVVVLGLIGFGLVIGAEELYRQTQALLRSGPNIVETALNGLLGNGQITFGGETVDLNSLATSISAGIDGYIGTNQADLLRVAREVAGRVLDSLLAIVISFYLLLDGKRFGPYLLKFVPLGSRARTGYVAGRINVMLGAYLRSQLLLILIGVVASFIILEFVFRVPSAIPLAIMTGVLEILPLIGPILAGAIAAGVALVAHGPLAAVGVAIAYLVLRQLQDQLITPLVVGRAVDLHPLATMFAILFAGAVIGPLGMLLAVPVAAAIKLLLDFLYPTTSEEALVEALPGLALAQRESVERGEEPAAG